MPSYNYKCQLCGHLYSEGRQSHEPQWVTTCPVKDCTGTLAEEI